MDTPKQQPAQPARSAAEQFGRTAAAYAVSRSHREGDSLEATAALAASGDRRFRHALDIATGAGFTAFALSPIAEHVVASDLTPEMLEQVRQLAAERQLTNIEPALANAEELPFPDADFDLVSCRIAAHHFTGFDRFLSEAHRVLEPGGVLVVCDTTAPEDPGISAWMNDIEVRRDPSHVWNRAPSEWLRSLDRAGFRVTDMRVCLVWHEFEDWTSRSQTPADERQRIRSDLLDAGPAHRTAFHISVEDGTVRWSWDSTVFRAERPG